MCDEIVCIENIVDLHATYSVLDLKLSMLIEEILILLEKFIELKKIMIKQFIILIKH